MSPNDLVTYYQNLLILQYRGMPKAYAHIGALVSQAILPQTTVQVITFSATPTAGSFTLSWNGNTSASIAYNDSIGTIQTKVQAISGLASATVTGSLASGLTVTFTGVSVFPAPMMTIGTSTLTASGSAVTATFTETDVTLPLTVRDAFSIDTAVGVQLDILGKYVGVTRNGYGFSSAISLNDTDFRSLIKIGIIRNISDSSLATINNLLNLYFPGQIYVFDGKNMNISYFISTSVGSLSLTQLFINEKLLPKPAGVQLAMSVYSSSIGSFFGFRTYDHAQAISTSFNTYDLYHMDRPWLIYDDGLTS